MRALLHLGRVGGLNGAHIARDRKESRRWRCGASQKLSPQCFQQVLHARSVMHAFCIVMTEKMCGVSAGGWSLHAGDGGRHVQGVGRHEGSATGCSVACRAAPILSGSTCVTRGAKCDNPTAPSPRYENLACQWELGGSYGSTIRPSVEGGALFTGRGSAHPKIAHFGRYGGRPQNWCGKVIVGTSPLYEVKSGMRASS